MNKVRFRDLRTNHQVTLGESILSDMIAISTHLEQDYPIREDEFAYPTPFDSDESDQPNKTVKETGTVP